jgi:beta-galactosidase
MTLPRHTNHVHYFGYGPNESYSDKKQSVWKGLFTTTAAQMFVNNIKPQENGARYGTDYAYVTDAHGLGWLVTGDAPFSLSASHYTAHDLEAAAHPHELTPRDATFVHIDYKNSAVGSNSCGPELHMKHRFNERVFCFKTRLLPVRKEDEGL